MPDEPRPFQCLFGVWPGQWEGKIYIDGKQVDIRNCQQAIAQGIATVPEDRKRDGSVVMAVGKKYYPRRTQ